jgi:hypothetical protein
MASVLALLALVSGCSSPSVAPTIPVNPKSTSSEAATSSAATSTPTASTDQTASEVCGCAVGTTLTVTGSQLKSNVNGKPSEAAAISAATTMLAKEEEATLSNVKVDSMTRDKKGVWWVLFSANEESAGAVKAVLIYDGKKWDERAYGLTITDTDLPSDVKF